MIKFILVFMISLTALKADIVFSGDCGSYKYDLNITNNRYFGGQCVEDRLIVYFNGASTDYIRYIYVDPQTSTWLDLYRMSDGRVYRSFAYNLGDVEFIGSPNLRLLYGFGGLLLGFLTIQLLFRSILRKG